MTKKYKSRMHNSGKPEIRSINCRCGALVRTSCCEYVCPRCGTRLASPASNHNYSPYLTYDYGENNG